MEEAVVALEDTAAAAGPSVDAEDARSVVARVD